MIGFDNGSVVSFAALLGCVSYHSDNSTKGALTFSSSMAQVHICMESCNVSDLIVTGYAHNRNVSRQNASRKGISDSVS